MLNAREAYEQSCQNMDYSEIEQKVESAISKATKRGLFSTEISFDSFDAAFAAKKVLELNGYRTKLDLTSAERPHMIRVYWHNPVERGWPTLRPHMNCGCGKHRHHGHPEQHTHAPEPNPPAREPRGERCSY